MALLCAARFLIAAVPFRIWRKGLGRTATAAAAPDPVAARRFAAQVNRAGSRLPFTTKCLPRAMALSWLLQYARSPHRLVLAVRPPELVKLGQIADVAGAPSGVTQNANKS